MTLLGADEKGVKSKETWKCFAKTVSGFLFSSDQFIGTFENLELKKDDCRKRKSAVYFFIKFNFCLLKAKFIYTHQPLLYMVSLSLF